MLFKIDPNLFWKYNRNDQIRTPQILFLRDVLMYDLEIYGKNKNITQKKISL